MAIGILLWCIGALAGTAVVAVAAARSRHATRMVYALCFAACGVALSAALVRLAADGGAAQTLTLPLGLPWLGAWFRL
ncbi:MAG: hydrogenase 4 subunit B, partial [Alphaproteobacteria bacterium]